MPKEQHPLHALLDYIPAESFDITVDYIRKYNIHLTISKARKSILGDYRPPQKGQGHRISVNGGLNKYSFLITLIHEIAHLVTFVNFGNYKQPHGIEWQRTYANLLEEYVQLNIFPEDIVIAIRKSQINPAASSCAEIHLTRALSQYDDRQDLLFVEQLHIGQKFVTKDGRLFEKGEKRRTRHFGREISTNKVYLFSGIYKVKLYTN
jgi:SprT protein